MRRLRSFIAGVAFGLTWAAVSQELAKPPEKREWRGEIGGIPYNFRVWEWPEVARSYWNPESDQILSPRPLGIGWSVNVAALSRRAQEWLHANPPQERRLPDVADRAPDAETL